MLTRSFTETDEKLYKIWKDGKENEAGGQDISHRLYDVGYKDGETDSYKAGIVNGVLGTVAAAVVISAATDFKRFVCRKIGEYKANRKNH